MPDPTPETLMLLSYLDAQRRHVLGILDGLGEEALRRPVLPSGWTGLGLLRHLALDVERFWFAGTVAADQTVIDRVTDGSDDDAWQVDAEVSAQSVLDLYRAEAARSDAVIAATSLDAPPAWWPADLFGTWQLENLREVVLHVITETATHAGHLDVYRELVDGRQWLVLTE